MATYLYNQTLQVSNYRKSFYQILYSYVFNKKKTFSYKNNFWTILKYMDTKYIF